MQLMIIVVVLLLIAIALITIGMWLGGKQEFRTGHACQYQKGRKMKTNR